MKKNKILLLMVLMACSLSLMACKENEKVNVDTEPKTDVVKEENEAVDEKPMTREYLIEKGIFTEEEMAGFDFDRWNDERGWIQGAEESSVFKNTIEEDKKNYSLDYATNGINYSYLETAEISGDKLTEEYISEAKLIFMTYNGDMRTVDYVFDLENKVAYQASNASLLEENAHPDLTKELTDELITSIKKSLSDNKVSQWETKYDGQDSESGETANYKLIIEAKDKIFSYEGKGMINGCPKELPQLEYDFQCFVQ